MKNTVAYVIEKSWFYLFIYLLQEWTVAGFGSQVTAASIVVADKPPYLL